MIWVLDVWTELLTLSHSVSLDVSSWEVHDKISGPHWLMLVTVLYWL